jgi:hypothetical protein
VLPNFVKDKDYIILLPNQEQLCRSAKQDNKNLGGSGLNKEKITITVDTFKRFCMKSRTDEIHDYYIKLEKILHETLEEESEELREVLLQKNKEIKDKENTIKFQEDELKKIKKIKSRLYIGHDPVMKNLYKIGITEDLTRRLEQHKTSNPLFRYLFTFESENVTDIENMMNEDFTYRLV